MRILVADDYEPTRALVESLLRNLGHDVVGVDSGDAAWQVLRTDPRPDIAVLDWMMPGLDGLEVCRRVRGLQQKTPTYIVLVSSRSGKQNIISGLDAGADDYIVKPFDNDELEARIQVGCRMVQLQADLLDHSRKLEEALAHVKKLQGIIPICSYCHKIRSREDQVWHRLEKYLEEHSEALFSHGICDECVEKHFPEHGKRHPEGG